MKKQIAERNTVSRSVAAIKRPWARGVARASKLAEVVTRAPVFLALLFLPAWTCPAVEAAAQAATILERGLDHRRWQTVRAVQVGENTVLRTNFYKEYSSGMHYRNEAGELVESREVINIVNGYGVADQAQHKAIFSPSITDSPATDYVDPSGERFQTRLMGIVFYDHVSGKSELIAEPKPSIGQVAGGTVTYPDAFDDVKCDVRYDFTRNSFEQNILVLRQFPDPSSYGMDSDSVWIQIWTEMLECPAPVKRTTVLHRETDEARRAVAVTPDLLDDRLIFRQCQIARGKAFLIENDAIVQAGIHIDKAVAVGKELARVEDRLFLVESVRYQSLRPLLATLPRMAATTPRTNQTSRLASSAPNESRASTLGSATEDGREQAVIPPKRPSAATRSQLVAAFSKAPQTLVAAPARLPELQRRQVKARTISERIAAISSTPKPRPTDAQLQVARADQQPRYASAVNLDYAILIGSTNTHTFKSDETSYISGNYSPAAAVFEGGTILKFSPTNHPCIYGAALTFLGEPLSPIILTASDDDTVGEPIENSTGSPGGHIYADPAFYSFEGARYEHLRISFADVAITLATEEGATNVVRHCQFTHCQAALQSIGCNAVTCENLLMYDIAAEAFDAEGEDNYFEVQATHLTIDVCDRLVSGSGTLYLTNSILAAVAEPGAWTVQTNAVVNLYSGAGVFQSLGAAAHYMTNTAYAHAGTTNISSALLNDLRQRSVLPPIVLSNRITNDTTLVPVVPRSTGAPPLGWAYPAVDFAVKSLVIATNSGTNATSLSTTLTVESGTVIATYGSVGLAPQDNTSIVCRGSPTNLVRFCRFYSVMELSTNWGGNSDPSAAYTILPYYYNSQSSTGSFRFTAFDGMSSCGYHLYSVDNSYSFASLTLQDCTANAGIFEINLQGAHSAVPSVILRNNLFQRTPCDFIGDFTLSVYNNLWKGGIADFENYGAHDFIIRDNSFHDCLVGYVGTLLHDHNAYINSNQITPTNTSDIVLTNFNYVAGPFGRFYQANFDLYDRGSRSATNAGLYWYGAVLDDEGNQYAEYSSTVEIGFHYLLADANGLPLDTDGDGVPNWLENISGTGVQQVGETDGNTPDGEFIPRYELLGPSTRRTPLVISEIMYHPASGGTEFIELYNSHHLPQKLDGFTLFNVDNKATLYTYPANTTLAAGSFLSITPASSLPNMPTTIQLRSQSGGILLEVKYSDTAPWPKHADGTGHSLVLARPSYGEGDPRAWAASATIGGSPGAAETNTFDLLRPIKINEFLANPTNGQAQYIELYNHCSFPIDVSGCFLSSRNGHLDDFRIPVTTIIPPRGFIYFTQGTNSGQFTLALQASGDNIYFTSADRTHVVDSVMFDAQDAGVALGRTPDGAATFSELAVRSPGATNTPALIRGIVINEIMFDPISGANADEYIELYNRSTSTVIMSNWGLSGGILFTITNFSLMPSNFLVIARSATNLAAHYPANQLMLGTNLLGDYTKNLGNNGDQITLTNASGVLMDEVIYSVGGRWGAWSSGGGSSLELVDPRSDNRLAMNWADSDETTKSVPTNITQTGLLILGDTQTNYVKGFEVSLLNAGECVVDNVGVLGTGNTNRITNTNFNANASGWSFEGNHETSGWSTNGTNGGYLYLRASGRGDYLANRVRTTWTTALTTGASCTISAQARWLRGSPEMLLRISGNYLEASATLPVPSNLGTPGLANSKAKANAGPAIFEVAHFPVVPATNQLVVVTAQINDPDGISNVVLHYRVDPATNRTSLTMLDDGTGGDAVARDGIYSATIPGQANGKLVAFYIRAADQFSPSATNTFPSDAPARECLVRFGESPASGSFGTYRLWMAQTNQDIWTSRSQIHAGALDATFVYNDQRVIYNIGAAYNGSDNTSILYNSPANGLCAYSLNFPADDQLLGATDFLLDWSLRDRTGQREQLAYWMAGQLGLPFNYRRFVHLYFNGTGENDRPSPDDNNYPCAHIYEDAQQPNSDFLSQWYPNDNSGELFKIQIWREGASWVNGVGSYPTESGISATLQNFTNSSGVKNLPSYRLNWRKRAVKDGANNYANLFALVDAVQTPADGSYIPSVEAMMDTEEWARIFALERSVGNLDCYGNVNGQNMYAYQGSKGTKWQLLLYDTELVFDTGGGYDGTDAALFANINDPRLIDFSNTNAFRRAYWRGFRDAINGPMQSTNYAPIVNGNFNALVANGVKKNEPESELMDLSADDLGTLTNWINDRRGYVSNELWKITAPFAITNSTNSTATNINLAGTAPVEIKFLRLDNRSTNEPITWLTVSNWSLPLVLSNGANAITVKGLDRRTNSIATNAVTITH